MLGAAPTKAAALITSLPFAAAALLVTGAFGLALSSGPRGTGYRASGCGRTKWGVWQEWRQAIKWMSVSCDAVDEC